MKLGIAITVLIVALGCDERSSVQKSPTDKPAEVRRASVPVQVAAPLPISPAPSPPRPSPPTATLVATTEPIEPPKITLTDAKRRLTEAQSKADKAMLQNWEYISAKGDFDSAQKSGDSKKIAYARLKVAQIKRKFYENDPAIRKAQAVIDGLVREQQLGVAAAKAAEAERKKAEDQEAQLAKEQVSSTDSPSPSSTAGAPSGGSRLSPGDYDTHVGPRGGIYHYGRNGKKVYEKKSK